MPPKRVSLAPGTKGGAKDVKGGIKDTKRDAKNIKAGAKNVRTPSKSTKPDNKSNKTTTGDKANPFQRASKDMNRAGDIRKQRDHFANVIAEERANKAREIQELHDKIDYYRKDNERILRQQTAKFGITLDNLKFVKEDLNQAKFANDNLLKELDARKEECDNLQLIMNDTVHKINELSQLKHDLNRERKQYEQEYEELARNEDRIHNLVEANRELRQTLLRNKINPNTDASQMGWKVKTASPKSLDQLNNATKLPVIYNKQNILSFRSDDSIALKPIPRKGILRRTQSTNTGINMTSRGFLTRRQSQPWMRRQSVDVISFN